MWIIDWDKTYFVKQTWKEVLFAKQWVWIFFSRHLSLGKIANNDEIDDEMVLHIWKRKYESWRLRQSLFSVFL